MHVTINQFRNYTGRGWKLTKEIYHAYLAIAERDERLGLTTKVISDLDGVDEKEVIKRLNGYS